MADKIQIQLVAYHVSGEYSRIALPRPGIVVGVMETEERTKGQHLLSTYYMLLTGTALFDSHNNRPKSQVLLTPFCRE